MQLWSLKKQEPALQCFIGEVNIQAVSNLGFCRSLKRLVKNGKVTMEFEAEVKEITDEKVTYTAGSVMKEVKNDFVFAMIGYHPDHSFLTKMGINIDQETGRPQFDPETMETNVKGIFIAGVIAAGNNANEIFIENGRFHGGLIASAIKDNRKSEQPLPRMTRFDHL